MIIDAATKDFTKIIELVEKEFPYKNLSEDILLKKINSGKLIILKAEKEKCLIGFAEAELFPWGARVNAITVIEKYREEGIGDALLKKMIKRLKGKGKEKIHLLVKENNKEAKNLYTKHGFNFVRIHPNLIDGSVIEEWEN